MKNKINSKYSVSVIIPCYNEEENIGNCVKRVPKLGKKTEIIVIDDGSKDDTAKVTKQLQKKIKNLKLISYRPNKGKGNAVRKGMDRAGGDVLMILDADMAVAPEDLPKFFKPIERGKAEFVNGTRFVYKMEEGAMGKLNYFGNILMGWMFTFALGQKITDSLCGTKVLFKKDYQKIGIARDDPWSDFSLLFGAARLGLKIVEVPVHYRKRVAGQSKMKFFQHSIKLWRVWFNQYWNFLSAKYGIKI